MEKELRYASKIAAYSQSDFLHSQIVSGSQQPKLREVQHTECMSSFIRENE